MRNKDTLIIAFFAILFLIVLYEKKFGSLSGSSAGQSSGGQDSAQSSEGGSEGKSSGTARGTSKNKSKNLISDVLQDFEDSLGLLDESDSSKPDSENDPNKEIKPPSGVSHTSYYDENGKFKSVYSGTELPKDFLTRKEFFTDHRKMQQDIEFKMMKMAMDMENERKEFERTHDFRGKDKEAYNKLLDDHRRMRRAISQKNSDTYSEFRREIYEYNSDLR